jgi:hypothetical protein
LTISATCLTVAVVISGAVSAKECIRVDETECFQQYIFLLEGVCLKNKSSSVLLDHFKIPLKFI